MAYIKLPITGTGASNDPFRPALPAAVRNLSNLRWSAQIMQNRDGTLRFSDCYVWIPDTLILPGNVTVINRSTAQGEMRLRDSTILISGMEF